MTCHEARSVRIEQIEIKNYRVFRSMRLTRLQPMTVVIGANGSGKSTLFDVFSFLKDALGGNVASAVARRGGFGELISRGETGPVSITVKFREAGGRLASYILEVSSEEGVTVVSREILRYRRGRGSGRPWHFVDFSRGRGTAITNESVYGEKGVVEEREEFELDDPSVLAIKGLGQFREFRVVSEFRGLIENWHISNFHIADARPSAEEGYAEHVSTPRRQRRPGSQVPLRASTGSSSTVVLDAMRSRVPGVADVEARSTEDGRLVLRFQDGSFEDPFIARHVSDGTIKMFAYLVMLHDPRPHPLLAVEEPGESTVSVPARRPDRGVQGLRPQGRSGVRIDPLAGFSRWCGSSRNLLVGEGERVFHCTARQRQRASVPLGAEGDHPSELWRQNLFDGANP